MKNTHIIRKLTDTERDNIYQDLEKIENFFNFHVLKSATYMKYGGLRDGQTVWLHGVDGAFFLNDQAKHIINFIEEHAKLTDNRIIGKTYVHRLSPNQQIFKHKDKTAEYFYNIDRYQIILDLPKNVEIYQKGSVVSNFSLIYFNHFIQHSYHNKSDKNWFIIVFDLYKCK